MFFGAKVEAGASGGGILTRKKPESHSCLLTVQAEEPMTVQEDVAPPDQSGGVVPGVRGS